MCNFVIVRNFLNVLWLVFKLFETAAIFFKTQSKMIIYLTDPIYLRQLSYLDLTKDIFINILDYVQIRKSRYQITIWS